MGRSVITYHDDVVIGRAAMVRKEHGAIGERVISGTQIGAGVSNILISTADDNFENCRGLRGEEIEYLANKF